MAGIHALYAAPDINGSRRPWFRCLDGRVIEPLDLLHLLFPNDAGESVGPGDNFCFVPRRFTFPPLRNLLPSPTEYFLPDDLVDAISCLLLLCLLVTVGMIVTKALWCWLDPQFASITPSHKQWYVVANMSKAFFLAILAISRRYWVGTYSGFFEDNFQMVEMKRCALIYVSTDLIALFMVPKLPRSTILHHVTTTTLFVIVSAMNVKVKGWGGLLGVCKMSVLYGTLSSVSFSVNAYLALRVVYPKSKWLMPLAKFSLWTYIACCAGNWLAHGLWMVGIIISLELSIFNLLYMVAIFFMVNDDIVLIKWLVNRSSPMATTISNTTKMNGEQCTASNS